MQIGSKFFFGGLSCKKLTVFLRLNSQKSTVYHRYDCIRSVRLYTLGVTVSLQFTFASGHFTTEKVNAGNWCTELVLTPHIPTKHHFQANFLIFSLGKPQNRHLWPYREHTVIPKVYSRTERIQSYRWYTVIPRVHSHFLEV